MATKPRIGTFTNSSVDVLNAIRNSATTNYRDYVPIATADAESIREIGAVIMDNPNLQNEFLHALINRIGMVIVTNKLYTNPWSVFKRGMLDFGETTEEIFVNIAKPFQFDPAVAESEIFKREIPDVRSAFHIMNYQVFYKDTISRKQLKQAFMSWGGVDDLISKIIQSMYTGAAYDEFQTMKYLLAKHLLSGHLHPVDLSSVSTANNPYADRVTQIKAISNAFEFLSTDYNMAGVANSCEKNSQYIIVNSLFDAGMDVNVLASAFNMTKADFVGHRILVDSFGKLDNARLGQLFANDPTYTEITKSEMQALDAIPCVLVDKDWFYIIDNLMENTDQPNGEGLYWQYWLHTWKTFSVSPFSNAAVFVPNTPTVTKITVTPSTATVTRGQSISLVANVTASNFAPKTVDWTCNTAGVTVNKAGVVTVDTSVSAGTTVTITAKSVYNPSVSATAKITVA